MTLYLTFPVAMFWIANQAEWFEDYVIQRKVGTGTVFMGSIQGMGERWVTNLLGTIVCSPPANPAPGGGLWRLLAHASSCYFVPTEGAVAT